MIEKILKASPVVSSQRANVLGDFKIFTGSFGIKETFSFNNGAGIHQPCIYLLELVIGKPHLCKEEKSSDLGSVKICGVGLNIK